jgi:hypothetical protein
MRKLFVLLAALLALLPVWAIAQTYHSDVLVIETAATSYTMLPIAVPYNVSNLATENFMASTGLDTRVMEGAAAKPHMLANDRVLFADDMPSYGSVSYQFNMGNAALSNFYVILGNGGSMTVPDAAALELGNEFNVYPWCYVDSSVYEDYPKTTIVGKDKAFWVYISSVGNVTARIIDTTWTSPTADGGVWTNPGYAWDDNTVTFANISINARSWSSYLTLSRASLEVDRYRFYLGAGMHADITTVEVDGYLGSAWVNLFTGPVVTGAWQETSCDVGSLADSTQVRLRLYNNGGVARVGRISEVDFGGTGAIDVTGAVSGFGQYQVRADTVNMELLRSSTVLDTQALGAVTTPDTATNWEFFTHGDAVVYTDQYLHYAPPLGGGADMEFDPVTVISGTTMPDVTGNGHDATITWGANPSGLTVLVDSLTPAAEVAAVEEPDIAPGFNPPAAMTTIDETTMGQNITWLTATVTNIGALTNTPVVFIWGLLAFTFVLCMMAAVQRYTQSLVLTGVTMVVCIGVCVGASLWPLWIMLIMAIIALGLLVAERSPAV